MNWYTGDTTYDTLLTLAFGIVALTVIGASFIQTPYGRFASDRYGLSLDPRLGWFLMELPATVFFLYFYFQGPTRSSPFRCSSSLSGWFTMPTAVGSCRH